MLSLARLSAIFALRARECEKCFFRYLHAVNCRRCAYSRIIATFFLCFKFSNLQLILNLTDANFNPCE